MTEEKSLEIKITTITHFFLVRKSEVCTAEREREREIGTRAQLTFQCPGKFKLTMNDGGIKPNIIECMLEKYGEVNSFIVKRLKVKDNEAIYSNAPTFKIRKITG